MSLETSLLMFRLMRRRAEDYLTERGYDSNDWRGLRLPPIKLDGRTMSGYANLQASIRAVADLIAHCDYVEEKCESDQDGARRAMATWAFVLGELVCSARVLATLDRAPLSIPTLSDDSATVSAGAVSTLYFEELLRRTRREQKAARKANSAVADRNTTRNESIRTAFENLSTKRLEHGKLTPTVEEFARHLKRSKRWDKWKTAEVTSRQLARILKATPRRES